MKIALVDPSLFTPAYDFALAEGLRANGHEVIVYGSELSPPSVERRPTGVREHFYRLANPRVEARLPQKLFLALKGFDHIGSMMRLVDALRAEGPDVIHFQWSPLPAWDRRVLPSLRKIAPLIFTVHDSQPFNNNPASGLQRLGATEIMRAFDKLIVHTRKAAQRVESYGVPAGRITQIPHGLLERLPPSPAQPEESEKGADERVTLLLFGHIKPYKGVPILLDAFSRLPMETRRGARLRIVGRPHMALEPVYEQIRQLGIGGQVEVEPRFVADEEIGALLTSADILLFPYTEIDASGVLMLALGAGKPMIASDIGLFSEMLDERHGTLVPAADPQALATAMQGLIVEPAVRAQKGAAVADLCRSIPSWAEIARRTVKLYEDAISSRA